MRETRWGGENRRVGGGGWKEKGEETKRGRVRDWERREGDVEGGR